MGGLGKFCLTQAFDSPQLINEICLSNSFLNDNDRKSVILPTAKTSELDMHIALQLSRPELNENLTASNLHSLIIYKKYRSFQSRKLSRVRGAILPREAFECFWGLGYRQAKTYIMHRLVKCFETKQVSDQKKVFVCTWWTQFIAPSYVLQTY